MVANGIETLQKMSKGRRPCPCRSLSHNIKQAADTTIRRRGQPTEVVPPRAEGKQNRVREMGKTTLLQRSSDKHRLYPGVMAYVISTSVRVESAHIFLIEMAVNGGASLDFKISS